MLSVTNVHILVPSEPPRNVKIERKTSTTISLSWLSPSNDSINGVLVGYRVNYQHNGKAYVGVDTTNNQTRVTLKRLGKYTNYTIRVAARTLRGPGRFSKPVNVMTDEDSK